MMRATPILLLTALLAPSVPAQEAKPVSAEARRTLTALLPSAFLKCQPQGPPSFYTDNLFEYINGAAEAFHMYEMAVMVHQEFVGGGVEVTVDIYDMATSLHAFGIYSAERSPEYNFLQAGAEGFLSESVLNFVQGRYYVKLSAFAEEGSAEPALRAFAEAISQRIGTDRGLPPELSLLPGLHRVERSEKYVRESPLGHEWLGPALSAVYRDAGKESTLIVSLAPSEPAARERAARLKAHFRKSGKVNPDPAIKGAVRGVNPYEGEMLFLASGPFTVVLAAPPADPAPLIADLLIQLSRQQ
jgi:hypothetical protein